MTAPAPPVLPRCRPSFRRGGAALRRLAAGLACVLAAGLWCAPAQAGDIYGYVDERGVAHFAAEKLDGRYQLFFRGGQYFDTAQGLGRARLPRGQGGAVKESPPPSSQQLLALFAQATHYKTARAALQDAARRHDIDYELLQALVAAESGFDPRAVSPKGALGLMQLMPATAQRYGVRGDGKRSLEDKLYDPRINIAAGSRYLRDLIARFDGSLELALAAYNAGEGAVQRAGNQIPNYRETQNYVKTVLALYTHLKPDSTMAARGRGGGRVPARVRMELPAAPDAAPPVRAAPPAG